MANFISSDKARNIAYDWHGGQYCELYAFASSGLIHDLQALIYRINHCLQLAGTKTDRRNLNSLLRFVKSNFIRKTASERYPYAAPWYQGSM